MFDIGFSEMIVIAVIALIVLGPEKLPRVARTVGHLLGRMQRYVNDVKADINREVELDELRKLQKEMQSTAQSLEQTVKSEISAVETDLKQLSDSTHAALSDIRDPLADAFADPPPMQPAAAAPAAPAAGSPQPAAVTAQSTTPSTAPPAAQLELGLDPAPLANAPPPAALASSSPSAAPAASSAAKV